MAGQSSEEGHTEAVKPPFRRKVDPAERDGMMKMIYMGTTANLLNCSPGRDPQHTVSFAYQVAATAWDHWIKMGKKEGIL
jgi:hypothetical protein